MGFWCFDSLASIAKKRSRGPVVACDSVARERRESRDDVVVTARTFWASSSWLRCRRSSANVPLLSSCLLAAARNRKFTIMHPSRGRPERGLAVARRGAVVLYVRTSKKITVMFTIMHLHYCNLSRDHQNHLLKGNFLLLPAEIGGPLPKEKRGRREEGGLAG